MPAYDPHPQRRAFGAGIVADNSAIRGLLRSCDRVGGIWRLDGFRRALVITNDYWIHQAHGVPQHCFLLAAVDGLEDPSRAGVGEPDDEEVLLLRVEDSGPLPDEGNTQRLRARAARAALTEHDRQVPRMRDDIVDPLTENEMQFAGLRCQILGTFYDQPEHGTTRLGFGSDVDAVYASSRYVVFKPYGDSLQRIVSYLDNIRSLEQPGVFRLGEVRYASTRRREQRAAADGKPTAVPVHVNVEDFVAHKTAVFGMTRLGKSNTMKTIATATFQFAAETGRRIGQLIFDPASEYAERNVQDGTALAELGPAYVRRFRFAATPQELRDDEGLRPLALNFFDERQIHATWEVTRGFLRARPPADYVNAFIAADPVGPDDGGDFSARALAKRVRFLFYASLLKAGLEPPRNWSFWAPLGAKEREAAAELPARHGGDLGYLRALPTRKGEVRLTAEQVLEVAETIAKATIGGQAPQPLIEWCERRPDIRAAAVILSGNTGSGHSILTPLRDGYHAAHARADYAPHIYEDLIAGRIVIVDLSRGNESVLQFASERIVTYLLAKAAERFRSGLPAHEIQIFIEEAHRLLDRDKFRDTHTPDPYVRLAKEAAKFRIGMIYATQEVTAVDDSILSNTANWVIAHLNNEREVKHLAGRYGLETFAEQILTAEDPGFVRLKTRSSRFVIPTQVRRFDADMVAVARDAARARETSAVPDTLPLDDQHGWRG